MLCVCVFLFWVLVFFLNFACLVKTRVSVHQVVRVLSNSNIPRRNLCQESPSDTSFLLHIFILSTCHFRLSMPDCQTNLVFIYSSNWVLQSMVPGLLLDVVGVVKEAPATNVINK